MEEIAFVGDECEVAELLVEGRSIAFGFVVTEKGEEAVFAALQVGLFALQEGVVECSPGDEAEDAEASEGDEEIPQHEPGPDGERTHGRLGRDEHVTGAVDGANERAAVGVVFKLGAEAVDVDVEGIFLDLGEVAPAGFDELFT